VRALGAASEGGAAVILLDDVLTTGATLAAVAARLAERGVPVAFAATIAATRLRAGGALSTPNGHDEAHAQIFRGCS